MNESVLATFQGLPCLLERVPAEVKGSSLLLTEALRMLYWREMQPQAARPLMTSQG